MDMMVRRIGLPATLLVSVLLAAAGAPDAAWAKAQGQVVVLQGSEPETLDSSISRGITELNPSLHVFDSLVRREGDMSLVPSLATSWKQLDPVTWEFKLRKDVRFHDGKPLTAEDVKFTFDRIMDVKTYRSEMKSLFHLLKEVAVPDPYTVKFHFTQPFSSFVRHLVLVPIVPKHAVQGKGHDKFLAAPLGSGPYKFVEWVKGKEIVLEANPTYWRGEPAIRKIIWRGVPEAATRVAALLAGDADIIIDVPVSFVEAINARPGYKIKTAPGNRVMFLQLNFHKKPLDDVRVRKATAHAIDVESIIKHVLRGYGIRANGPIPPGVFGHNPTLAPYPFDPQKAKALLKEAGYEKGFDLTLTAPMGRYLLGTEVAQAIAGNLDKVGIRMKLNFMETSAFWPYIQYRQREKNLTRVDANFWGMANFTLDAFYNYSGTTITAAGSNPFLSHPELDKMIAEALATTDEAKTEKLFQEASRILHEDLLAYIYLYYTINLFAGNERKLEWAPRADERVYVYDMKLKSP
jgi:peptide/nickel transport system substrate-binding protein